MDASRKHCAVAACIFVAPKALGPNAVARWPTSTLCKASFVETPAAWSTPCVGHEAKAKLACVLS